MTGVKQIFDIVLTCLSLVAEGIECILKFFLAICISSYVNCLLTVGHLLIKFSSWCLVRFFEFFVCSCC